MTQRLMPGMAEATRLTRAGKLAEATALIQQLLRPSAPAVAETVAAEPARDAAIDGEFVRLDAAPAPTAAAPTAQPRSPLRETLRRIAAGGMPAARKTGSTAPGVLPHGAAFRAEVLADASGPRDYRLYIPASAGGKRDLPLVVMLHGCTQTPEDFATGTGMNALAEEFGCLVAYPAQPGAANANKCWNWFRPEDQARGKGEPASLAAVTRRILHDHPVDPARVYVAGLSAGGAAALIMADAYPELFAAVGVHSGLPLGAAHDIPSAFMAMRNGAAGDRLARPKPVIVFHGDADATVHPRNARSIVARSLAALPDLKAQAEQGRSPGGQTYTRHRHCTADGVALCEYWDLGGAGHAWAGGHAAGSHTDPSGPDASRAMLEFFLQQRVE
jgi:poly(hydroxyalkanoate) depolymerase family esterase